MSLSYYTSNAPFYCTYKHTVSKYYIIYKVIHTCGPIHQQFNWLPKLTRSCSLFQVALLTLRSRVSSPLEVGGNTQPNCACLTPSLSSFLFFCLPAGPVSLFCPASPLKFCLLTPFPQRFNDFYSFAYADDIGLSHSYLASPVSPFNQSDCCPLSTTKQ